MTEQKQSYDFFTKSGKHSYTFFGIGSKTLPDLSGSKLHVHKTAENVSDFIHWLKFLAEERYIKYGYFIRYVVERESYTIEGTMEKCYEAVFYRKEGFSSGGDVL